MTHGYLLIVINGYVEPVWIKWDNVYISRWSSTLLEYETWCVHLGLSENDMSLIHWVIMFPIEMFHFGGLSIIQSEYIPQYWDILISHKPTNVEILWMFTVKNGNIWMFRNNKRYKTNNRRDLSLDMNGRLMCFLKQLNMIFGWIVVNPCL